MSAIFFSIIIPTYNRPDALHDIIKHVLTQRFTNWEIIIVDDSRISNGHIISEFNDIRLIYIYRGYKLGVSSARNHGAAKANGKYVVFLDDDDQVSESWLLDFASLADQNQEAQVLFCAYEMTDTFTKKKSRFYPGKELWRVVFPGSFIIKTDFFQALGGYDEAILYGENTELFFRIRASNYTYAFTEKVNYFYFPSINGGSKNLVNIIESNKIILKKHSVYFSKNKHVKKYYLRVIGVSLIKLTKVKESRIYLFNSYLIAPLELKGLLRFCISFFSFLAFKIYKPRV